jgi:hypothetical protein
MSIKLIGAGFPRTGTMSLKRAIEELGFGPCYHMIDFVRDNSTIDFWEAKFKKQNSDWSSLLSQHVSIVDFPGSLFYKELIKYYPKAKIILTVRESDSWYESVRSTVISTGKNAESTKISEAEKLRVENFKRMRQLIWGEVFEGRQNDKTYMIERYEMHNAEVRELVPSSKLLEYSVKEGWNPLASFLETEIPDSSFPHANVRADFHGMLANEKEAFLKNLKPK